MKEIIYEEEYLLIVPIRFLPIHPSSFIPHPSPTPSSFLISFRSSVRALEFFHEGDESLDAFARESVVY